MQKTDCSRLAGEGGHSRQAGERKEEGNVTQKYRPQEPLVPKVRPEAGGAKRMTVIPSWPKALVVTTDPDPENRTRTSSTDSTSGSGNISINPGEVTEEGSNGNHVPRDVSCSEETASSSLTPLTFPKLPMKGVTITVGKKLSLSQSIKAAQKNLVDRIEAFIKNRLFRGVKFVTSDAMLCKVMTAVEKNETTHANMTDNSGFKRVYSITVMKVLSDKKGACAAAGGRIVQSMC